MPTLSKIRSLHLGKRHAQPFDLGRFVINGVIKPQFFNQPIALLLTARDDAAASELAS